MLGDGAKEKNRTRIELRSMRCLLTEMQVRSFDSSCPPSLYWLAVGALRAGCGLILYILHNVSASS